jgi:hypothetical protein
VDLHTARLYFNSCLRRVEKSGLEISTIDGIKEYLANSAKRSKNSHNFVNGVIKIIERTERMLTEQEKEAVQVFRRNNFSRIQDFHEDGIVREESVEEEVARLKSIANANASDYEDVSWIPSTTCEVERFFSQCKLNHSDKRIALTNDNLEMIMFLKCHELSVKIVEQALKADK